MQDIRWKAFWLHTALCFVCTLVWIIADATWAFSAYVLCLLSYLIGHLYWLHKLYEWLLKPTIHFIPNGHGIWEEVFAYIYQLQRNNRLSKSQLTSALERFMRATSVLPDAVVVLNNRNEIEWFNEPAEQRLGLKKSQDESQPIYYLVRQNEFVRYLNSNDYSEPIRLKSWRMQHVTLELQIIPFDTKQKLLICRDVSALEQTEIMRRDFIANVSHELRTPLTVISGFLETISDIKGGVSKKTKPYFEMMQQQATRMRHLIEDLLLLSQIESNVSDTEDSKINMQDMMQLLKNDAQALSQAKHQIVIEEVAPYYLKGTYTEILSALSNLVSNAVRYTPAKGVITLRWTLNEAQGEFTVQDTGIGIEAQHIPRLTERFYRVDTGRSRDSGGTGLGLSIVKHILYRHQAQLKIESEIGIGSVFKITFPQQRLESKT